MSFTRGNDPLQTLDVGSAWKDDIFFFSPYAYNIGTELFIRFVPIVYDEGYEGYVKRFCAGTYDRHGKNIPYYRYMSRVIIDGKVKILVYSGHINKQVMIFPDLLREGQEAAFKLTVGDIDRNRGVIFSDKCQYDIVYGENYRLLPEETRRIYKKYSLEYYARKIEKSPINKKPY